MFQGLKQLNYSMEDIMSVSLYKDVEAMLIGDKSEKKKEIFDPQNVRTPPMEVR